jgi:PKD repeat protein
MNRLFLVLIVFLFIFNAGCKKKIEEPATEETPVFYFNGNIGAIPVALQAGVNNYYMYSFYKQDSSNGLYSFWGNIRQINCNNCLNHLALKIFDSKLSAIGGVSSIDTTLNPSNYIYFRDTITSAKQFVTFTSSTSPDDTVQSYLWSFGDGTSSTLPNPVHEYNGGNFYACLTITYKNGCQGNSCNPITIVPTKPNECSVSILDSVRTGNSLKFNAISKSANPVAYSWNFNDSASGKNTSTIQNPSHDFSAPGIYRVVVQISNSACKSQATKNVATPNFTNGCYANYTFTALPNNQFPFSKIVIYWTNTAGDIYSSENVTQPADSYFEILSVDEYMLNENKQRTKKIHAKFKCLLSDGKSSISVTDGDAVFAVAFR